MHHGPKVLVLDIETLPLEAFIWSPWNQDVPKNQIKKDWSVISWAAKWLDEKKVFQEDSRKQKDLRNDKKLLKGIWKLIDEADIIISQNGVSFDIKKLNARFEINGFKPPSSFKNIDTKLMASSIFGFTYNSLEYLSEKLNKKYKKLKHKKFPGFELWNECMKGNQKAWKEMAKYNIHDVLATEELYKTLIKWNPNAINFNVYSDLLQNKCICGNSDFYSRGFRYTASGKFNRYICKKCGKENRGQINLLSPEKKKALRIK